MNNKSMKTPTGMRDFSRGETVLRESMVKTIKEVYERYGFLPIDTPAMEFLDVLTAKSGEEIKEQIFIIKGEDIGLRFDLTVPLARYVAGKLDLPKPFKRYAIAKVWRNEEAQKGRYREFIQADADIIGVKEPTAEVELLYMAKEALTKLGFDVRKENFLINDRRFLFAYAEAMNAKEPFFFRTIDKIDKIGKEGVLKLLKKRYNNAEKIIDELSNAKDPLKFIKEYSDEAYEALAFITSRFGGRIDLTLVRGLDYYTGPIFEVKLSDKIGSVAGGGRYDELLSIYGQGDYAVGISLGFERLYYLLSKKAEGKQTIDFYIAFIGDNFDYAFEVAQALRKKGYRVDMNYSKRSLSKQLEYASNMGFKKVIIVGDKEREKNVVTLRDMESGEQKEMDKEFI